MFRRAEKYDFKRFCREGDYIRKKNKEVYVMIAKATTGYMVIAVPKIIITGGIAFADVGEVLEVTADGNANPFDNLIDTLLRLFDSAVVIALIICGATWAAGYRAQSIERLIYIGAGYILARHAVDIRDFLKTI